MTVIDFDIWSSSCYLAGAALLTFGVYVFFKESL